MNRVPVLEDLLAGRAGGASERSDLVKLATRLIVEEALESEVDDQLGRGDYAHGAQAGHRNCYRTGRLKSAEGAIEYAVPQMRGTVSAYHSQIRQALVKGRTEELEHLAIEMYARGLSLRDIERSFTDRRGECLLSKSAVSELTEGLWADYQAFAGRDLSEHCVVYLLVDGLVGRLHLGQPREARACRPAASRH